MPKAKEKPSILPVVLPLVLLLVISAHLSRGELAYLLRARRATATVDSSERMLLPGTPRTRRMVQEVTFHFRDAAGSQWQGRDRLDNYWEAPEVGGKVRVEYLRGRRRSARIVGNGAKLAPALFIFSVLALATVGGVLAWERRSKRRRRGKKTPGAGPGPLSE
jgi:hypothetical protein